MPTGNQNKIPSRLLRIVQGVLQFFLVPFVVMTTVLLTQPLSNFLGPLNTQNVEFNPIISPNGRYVVFQSNRPGGQGGMDIWLSENIHYPDRIQTPEWSAPINFRELNTPGMEGMFTILFTADEKPKEIYLTSLRDITSGRDGYLGTNIYFTEKNPATEKWKEPIHVNEINSNFDDKMPSISPDGKTIVFSSNRPGGVGGFDLWISYRSATGKWSEPVNLGPKINTKGNEYMPSWHFDNELLVFSSDRDDVEKKTNFYGVRRQKDYSSSSSAFEKTNGFGEVFNIGKPFNTRGFGKEDFSDKEYADNEGMSFTHDGLWVYFSSNRRFGEGQFDIYRTAMPEELRGVYDFVFRGLVLDGSEKVMIGLDATLKIFEEEGPIKIITSKRIGGDLLKTDSENFRTVVKTGKFYRVEISSPGFQPAQILLDTRGTVGLGKEQYSVIKLLPVKEIASIDPSKNPENNQNANDPSKLGTGDSSKLGTGDSNTKDPNGDKIKNPNLDLNTLKENTIFFRIKDKKTGKDLIPEKIEWFTEVSRGGKNLKLDPTGRYLIEEIPKTDFEVHVFAKGYQDETKFYRASELPVLKTNENIIFLTSLDDIPAAFQEIIYFPFNERKLRKSEFPKLDRMAKYLLENPSEKLEIAGHTDNVATKEYNEKLGMDRTIAVRDYLREKGVSDSRMKLQSYYYSEPAASNDTEEGRAKNRRVNFKQMIN